MKKTIFIMIISLFIMGLYAIGGDTFGTAVQITELPYTDSGDTSTLTNSVANPSYDAIYRINSVLELTNVEVSMLNSSFDTYLWIYNADMTTVFASNDDYGESVMSYIGGLTLAANTDYYIICEGYSSNNGAYQLDVAADQTGLITSTTVPVTITDILPVNGAVNQALDTTISWTFGANTETYDVYFGTANPPVTMVVDNAVAGVTGTYDPGPLASGTTYYWKVVSRNTASRLETESSIKNFTTIFGAVTSYPYTQQFDTWPVPGWTLSGTRSWAPYTPAGTPIPSIYCNFWGWSTGNAVITTVEFDATGITPSLAFDWSHAYNSSYPNDAMRVSISTDAGLNWTEIWYRVGTAFESADGAGNTSPGTFVTEIVSLSAYANTTFMLQFDGISGYGPDLYLDNVNIIDFNNPPAPTTLVTPADGSIDQLTGGTIQWNSASYADGYDLYFGTDNPPTSILNGVDQGTALSYAYSGLTGGVTYYWQVVPYNVNGDAVGAPVWSFTTAAIPPNPVTLISPADESVDIYFNVELSWNQDVLADGYYLNFGTDNPPTNIENMTDNGIADYYMANDLAGNTAYYWQVIPYNSNGNAVGCPVWSFTTSANTPSEIVMTAPADLATGVSEYTTFTWNADAWAYGYNLYIGTDGVNYVMTDVGNLTGITLTTPLNYETMYYWYVTAYNPNGEGPDPAAVRTFTVQSNLNYGGDGVLYGGYYFANSEPEGNGLGYQPTFNWVDISSTGSIPVYSDPDDGYVQVDIGFTFNYFGNDYTQIYLGTNGYCMFTNPTTTTASSMSIPSTDPPNDVIVVAGMDLHTGDVPSNCYYGLDADGNFVYTVEMWSDYNDPTEYMDMQMILYPNGRIKAQYRNYVNPFGDTGTSSIPGDACIGIENIDGSVGLQYRNNGVGGPMLEDMALAFATTPEGLAEPVAPLGTPANVILSYSGGLMNLTWDAVTGATSYNVYASEVPDFAADGTTFLQNVPVNALAGNHYFVKITADDTVLRTHSYVPIRRSYRNYGFIEFKESPVEIEKAKK
jgi:hypothetical protein